MAFPDFSEFSFAYAVVRKIEAGLGGMMAVPNFPTQNQEADLGYDVNFLSQRIPIFIQFKRSEVMVRHSCGECQNNKAKLSLPIFRMHLHNRNNYRQHFLLQDLEAAGSIALYCTSAVQNKSEMDQFYATDQIFKASAIFIPSDIDLPSLNKEHYVSFDKQRQRWCVYSDAGEPFEQDVPNIGTVIDHLRLRPPTSMEAELSRLQAIANDFANIGPERMAQRQREFEFEEETYPTVLEEEDAREVSERRQRQLQIRDVRSVVIQVALQAYFEVDAFLIAVPREAVGQ